MIGIIFEPSQAVITYFFQDRSCYWDVSNPLSKKINGSGKSTVEQKISPENFLCKTPNHRLKCKEKPAKCSQGKPNILCDKYWLLCFFAIQYKISYSGYCVVLTKTIEIEAYLEIEAIEIEA